MEGGAGFEPTSFCCAADVLPEAPPARIAAGVGGIRPKRLGQFIIPIPYINLHETVH